MTTDEQKEFGQRVAFLRKKLGLSQAAFARRIDRSETWVSQVERGVRTIDRVSVLQRLAEALGVDVAVLAPDRAGAAGRSSATPSTASELALTLASSEALRALLTTGEQVAVADVEARAAQAWEYTHAARYEQLTDVLVDLIPDVELAVRQATGDEERDRALRAKARTYLAAAGALAKLGEFGAAWVATDRAITAADSLADPLLAGEGAFRLAITFQVAGRFDMAARVAATAAQAIDNLASRPDADPAAVAIYGALHLQRAVAAARMNDADSAYAHLETARAAAERIGEGRNDFNTEFGPANVLLHEAAVAVELGDAGRALRAAELADTRGLSPERRSRLLIDIARAQAQLRRPDAVIAALAEGAAIAPEQYASHPRVRELVADLLRTERGEDPRLRALVEEIHLQA